MQYTKTYFRAIRLLIGDEKAPANETRQVIARALRQIRKVDKPRAIRERNHMRQIKGQFPQKTP